MPLICLFGPDGAGKTSIARALKVELVRRGFSVRISWMRGTHTLASLLARMMSKFPSFAGNDNFYYHISIPRRLLHLWQFVEFVSMLPVLFTRFLLLSVMKDFVIAERYIPDFIVWVALTTNDPTYPRSFGARFLISLLRRTRIKVYITAEYAELLNRRDDVDPSFLRQQLDLYEKLARYIGASRVDTTWTNVGESSQALIDLMDRDLAQKGRRLQSH